jgi:hypothetical protein
LFKRFDKTTHLYSLAERVKKFGDQARPACLVRGAKSLARIAVKILVKEKVVFEMRVGLKFLMIAEEGSLAALVLQKDAR